MNFIASLLSDFWKLSASLKLTIFFLIIIAVLSLIINNQRNELNQTKFQYNNALAKADSIRDDLDGWKSKYAQELTKTSALGADIVFKDAQIQDLLKRLKNDLKLISAMKIEIAAQSDTGKMKIDTVYKPSQIPLDFGFSESIHGIGIKGRVTNPPPAVSITLERPSFALYVLLTKEKYGMYRTEVKPSNAFFQISNIETRVITDEQGNIETKHKIPISGSILTGWTHDQGYLGEIRLNIWLAEAFGMAKNKGFDYGGKFKLLEKKIW